MVISKIHNVFKNLTETEQKIASYILEFPEKIVNMTSKELASACGTVPSAPTLPRKKPNRYSRYHR